MPFLLYFAANTQIVSHSMGGGHLFSLPFIMRTDAEKNYAAEAARIRRASREDKPSLLD